MMTKSLDFTTIRNVAISLSGASLFSVLAATPAWAACDMVIDAVAAAKINAALQKGPVSISATGAGCTGIGSVVENGNGDIIVTAPLNLTSTNSLTLNADRSITTKASVIFSGSKLALNYDVAKKNGTLNSAAPSSITIAKGAILINGKTYKLIKSKTDLQNMQTAGYYALNANLTFTGTANFTPIGWTYSENNRFPTPFIGSFEGLGHTIKGLSIDIQNSYNLGLFSIVGSVSSERSFVRNVNFDGGGVTLSKTGGSATSAGMVTGACINCTLQNIQSSAPVKMLNSTKDAGGLVGSLGQNGLIKTVAVSADMIAGEYGSSFGGVAGSTSGSSTIDGAVFKGTIAVTPVSALNFNGVGGIAGWALGTVKNSHAFGSITATNNYSAFATRIPLKILMPSVRSRPAFPRPTSVASSAIKTVPRSNPTASQELQRHPRPTLVA